jgi:hypothetical protein
MNVKRIEGAALNFWVAKSARLQLSPQSSAQSQTHDPDSGYWHPRTFSPSEDWSQAGPLITNDWFAIEDTLMGWFGPDWMRVPAIKQSPLIWFMRAYVASQFGDTVEDILVPQTLELNSSSIPPGNG